VTLVADAGGSYLPDSPWWAGWNLDPVLLLNLALMSYVYQRGLGRLWRAETGRAVAPWRVGCFAAGLFVMFVSLASPLDALSAELSAAHMVQHMLVMNVAAPLVALGSPGIVLLSGVPQVYRRPLGKLWRRIDPPGPGGVFRNPVVPWVLYAVALWAWHLPALYQSALSDPVVHDFQHLTFFAAAFVFWRVALDQVGHVGPGAALASLFTTSLHATVLGVFMTLAPRPWYRAYEGRTDAWGLTALEDQQLAGLIMWMPACLAYLIGAVGVLAVWIANQEAASWHAQSGSPRQFS
jgi:putative membrane protein